MPKVMPRDYSWGFFYDLKIHFQIQHNWINDLHMYHMYVSNDPVLVPLVTVTLWWVDTKKYKLYLSVYEVKQAIKTRIVFNQGHEPCT